MKAIKCLFILLAVTVGCGAAEKPPANEKKDTDAIMKGSNKFALELYAKLRTNEGNLFFSPYSISTALAMTYAGARGETESQMADVLHFAPLPDNVECSQNKEQFHSAFGAIIKDLNSRGAKGSFQLTVANALWGQKGYGFVPEFLQLVKDNYGGGLNEVDFVTAAEDARNTINAWVEKETKGKIKELIGQGVLNQLTRLVLTNAIYFKGNWASRFEKDRTTDEPFTLPGGRKINAAMMNQTAEFNYAESDSFQSLELPYVDNELSMIILLPKKADGLAGLEEELTQDNLSQWLEKLHKCKVIVSVPKFKQTSQFSLAAVLQAMGLTDAFSPDKADFSGMNGKKDLFISAVVHKAYIEVNEEGTEAAAATGVVMGLTSVGPGSIKIPVFRADHPFLFLIHDNLSGSILFIGRVTKPART